MGDPTRQQLKVAIEAVHTDAKMWKKAGDQLGTARSAADPLDLQEFHFSYIGDKVGMTRAYAELKAKLIRLLGEGSTQLHQLSTALDAAANQYQAEEDNNYHEIHHLY
jgi:hypothetical protein